VKEQLVNSRISWGQAPTAWDAPGWAPLVDHGPASLHAARSIGRWLWPTVAVTSFLAVTSFVLGHDDPTPGLSLRGLSTIALGAVVVVLLTLRRAAGPGPLTRALFEYAVVFLLAVLVATTGVPVDQAPTGAGRASAARDQRPALIKTVDSFRDWLGEWRAWAREQNDRRNRPPSTTNPAPTGDAMTPPSPALSAATRRLL
jgi:hypothetical protein